MKMLSSVEGKLSSLSKNTRWTAGAVRSSLAPVPVCGCSPGTSMVIEGTEIDGVPQVYPSKYLLANLLRSMCSRRISAPCLRGIVVGAANLAVLGTAFRARGGSPVRPPIVGGFEYLRISPAATALRLGVLRYSDRSVNSPVVARDSGDVLSTTE